MLQVYYYDVYGLKTLKSISSKRTELFVSDSEFPYIYRVILRNNKFVSSGIMTIEQFTKYTKDYHKEDVVKSKNSVQISLKRRLVSHMDKVDSGIKFTKENFSYIKEMRKKIFGKEFLNMCLCVSTNKRYNVKINSAAYLVNFEDLDPVSMLFRFGSVNEGFHKHWSIFTKNYKNLKPVLEKNLWARQRFISFLAKHNKMEKLGMKRYKWIMDSTPEFYLMGFKTREINNDMHCSRHPFNKKPYSECKYIERIKDDKKLKEDQFGCEIDSMYGKWPCNCDKTDCYFIAKNRIFQKSFRYHYGCLNNTKSIYNAFVLKKPDIVCVDNHFSTLQYFYNIDPHYFVGYQALDSYGKSKDIKDFRLFFQNNKSYLKKYIDNKYSVITKYNPNHIRVCRPILMNIIDHAMDLLDNKTLIKLQKTLLISI